MPVLPSLVIAGGDWGLMQWKRVTGNYLELKTFTNTVYLEWCPIG